MARFHLLDESLAGEAGHHAAFAVAILTAAETLGYAPALAVHRDFAGVPLAAHWPAYPVFRRRLYDDPLLMPREGSGVGGQGSGRLTTLGNEVSHRSPSRGWLSEWRDRWRSWRKGGAHGAWVHEYLVGLEAWEQAAPLAEGDHVLVAAAGPGTLAAFAAHWERQPPPTGVQWHFVFHFNALAGLPEDWPAQHHRAASLRATWERFCRVAPQRATHLWTTTDELTTQFQSIVTGSRTSPESSPPFRTLGYPIDADPLPPRPRPTAGPLQVTFAGDARLEKGYQYLAEIVADLEPERNAGRLRFVLQSNFAFKMPCRRRNRPVVESRARLATLDPASVTLLTDPLPAADYRALVAATDLAILPYHAPHYYARCSGVLLEMLLAGVPVIVPGDGWMARQVQTLAHDRPPGLTFRSPREIPSLVRQLLRDFPAYQSAAIQAGETLRQIHSPRRLVETLLRAEPSPLETSLRP